MPQKYISSSSPALLCSGTVNCSGPANCGALSLTSSTTTVTGKKSSVSLFVRLSYARTINCKGEEKKNEVNAHKYGKQRRGHNVILYINCATYYTVQTCLTHVKLRELLAIHRFEHIQVTGVFVQLEHVGWIRGDSFSFDGVV